MRPGVVETHELRVDFVPSSQNARQRMHWRTRSQEDGVIQIFTQQAWSRAGRPKAHGRPCRVEVTVRLEGRADDEDNRLARLKPVFDKLISLGVLVDDSPTWCRHSIPTREPAPRGKGHLLIALHYVEAW
jgi:hypothetical protein